MLIARVRRHFLSSRVLGCPFSSSSSSSDVWDFLSSSSPSLSSGGGGRRAGETMSPVLRQAQLTRPPPTLSGRDLNWNACSFIGVVVSPLMRFDTKATDKIGFYTWLEVKARPSAASSPSFQILLAFWDEPAEKASRHLQKEDLIYVWGSLHSYQKIGESGKREILQKLTVRDLNYVQRNKKSQISLHPQNSDEESTTVSCDGEQDHNRKSGDRLRLWQVFFANPHEWWDNRHSKRHPWTPEFRHKDTREELTLSPDDPPWVEKQLELYDLKMRERRPQNRGDWSSVI